MLYWSFLFYGHSSVTHFSYVPFHLTHHVFFFSVWHINTCPFIDIPLILIAYKRTLSHVSLAHRSCQGITYSASSSVNSWPSVNVVLLEFLASCCHSLLLASVLDSVSTFWSLTFVNSSCSYLYFYHWPVIIFYRLFFFSFWITTAVTPNTSQSYVTVITGDF